MMSNTLESRVQECNCDQANLHLHVEIENLKQRLLERDRHIVKMETNFLKEAEKFPNGEFAAVMEQLYTWQEKYSRLYESHKRVQKVNQSLEDKLLKIVDKCETEKTILSAEITNLIKTQIEQQMYNAKLHEENERYRNDLNIAIQLLQCKPSNFVPQKFDSLPPDIQIKVKSHIANKQRKLSDGSSGMSTTTTKSEMKTIKVPIPTFPPTAMVYSLDRDKDVINETSDNNKSSSQVDIVSAAIMAKILEEREKERLNAKHCRTCCCVQNDRTRTKSVQTDNNRNESFSTSRNHLLSTNYDHHQQQQQPDNSSIDAVSSSSSIANVARTDDCRNVDLIDLTDNYDGNNCEDKKNVNNNNFNHLDDDNATAVSNDCVPTTTDEHRRWKESIVDEGLKVVSTSSNVFKGPRLCSVRLQTDTNNILLDNAVQFSAPILYKRRQSQDNGSEPMVHHAKIVASTTTANVPPLIVRDNYK